MAATLMWVGALAAQTFPGTSAGLVVETRAERRIVTATSDGPRIEFIVAEQLRVGDEICYTLRVRNVTDKSIPAPVIVKALPLNTQYIHDSAVGPAARVSVSVDGGVNFLESADVSTSPTHLRWQLKHALAPGAVALLRFRGEFK